MGSLASLAGNLTLFFRIHGGETALRATATTTTVASPVPLFFFILIVLLLVATLTAMGSLASLASNLALFFRVHGSKPTLGAAAVATTATAIGFLAFVFIVFLLASSTASVRRFTSHARNFTLLFRVHGSKPTLGTAATATTAVASPVPLFFLIIVFLLTFSPAAVRRLTSHAGNLTLFFWVHGSKPTLGAAAVATTATATAIGFLAFVLIVFLLASSPSSVRRFASHARNFTLLFRIHGSEATPCRLAVAVSRLTVAMCNIAVSLCFFLFTLIIKSCGVTVMMCSRLVIEGSLTVMRCLTALASDPCHVLPILAHHFASLAAGLGGFFRVKFVSRSFFVGSFSSLAGNFTLFFFVHGSKPTFLRRHSFSPLG